jgi:hypothetical protein
VAWDLSNGGCPNPFLIETNHFYMKSNPARKRSATVFSSAHISPHSSHSDSSQKSALFVDIADYKPAPTLDPSIIKIPELPSSILSTPPYRAEKQHPSPTIDPSALGVQKCL